METEGSKILDEACSFIQRFAVLPSEATIHTMAVWGAHTWAYTAFWNTPRLGFLSDLPKSGKSRAIRLTECLSMNPKYMTNYTEAGLRINAMKGRTLALDETDTIFRSNASAPKMQAILNAGWQADGTADQVQGNKTLEHSVFCPITFAGLNQLPDATMTRTIVVVMQRRRKEQQIEAFQPRMHLPIGRAIGEALGAWVQSHALELAAAWPDLPDGVEDRDAEKWSPLLALADVAGGPWPERIAKACDEFVNGVSAEPVVPPLAQLLADIQTVWTGERLSSADLCGRLLALQGAKWGSIWPETAAPRELAALLRGADITPRKMRIDGGNPVQGYDRSMFVPHWDAAVPEEQTA